MSVKSINRNPQKARPTMSVNVSDINYEGVLTILEQADQACKNHNSDAARRYIGTLKMLLYGLRTGDMEIVRPEVT